MPPVDGLPALPVPAEHDKRLIGYDCEKPVFVGHYWLQPPVAAFNEQIACLDYSVAAGGVLAAYRFDGESTIDNAKFVTV